MNIRLPLLLLVISATVNVGESGWFHSVTNFAKKALPIVKKVGTTGLKFVQKHPEVLTAAALLDEEFLDNMKALKVEDQDLYDHNIEALRSEFSRLMTDEDADEVINDFKSLIAMDASDDKGRASDEFLQKLSSSLLE